MARPEAQIGGKFARSLRRPSGARLLEDDRIKLRIVPFDAFDCGLHELGGLHLFLGRLPTMAELSQKS